VNTEYEKACVICLKEMFKRVGEKYPNKELTGQKEWYTKRTWTEAEESSFRKWMEKYLSKKFKHWTKKTLDIEIAMFMLMWGWKTV
jgi:hypothetical protein